MTTTQETTVTETTNLTIRGREFAVSTKTEANGELRYILTGKRGAVYGTMRNRVHPEMMFIIDGRGFGIPGSMEGVWLTDKSGKLEIARR